LVVGVRGDEVHLVVGLGEHGGFPRPERRHAGAGAPARDQFQSWVDQPHGTSGLGSKPAVLRRGLVTDLPRTVHLVAQAPYAYAVRLGRPVSTAQVGERRT